MDWFRLGEINENQDSCTNYTQIFSGISKLFSLAWIKQNYFQLKVINSNQVKLFEIEWNQFELGIENSFESWWIIIYIIRIKSNRKD